MIDMEKLSPLPLQFKTADFIKEVVDANGKWIADFDKDADGEWYVMAREAHAAQVEYGWGAVQLRGGQWAGAWYVEHIGDDSIRFTSDHQNRFPDPVVALATAYRWKKSREAKATTDGEVKP